GGTPAVLLRLDHFGLRVLRRICAPGAGRGHALDLRRADDQRIRLVASGALGRGIAGWNHGGGSLAPDRPDPGPARRPHDAVRGRARDRRLDHAAVADAVAAGVLRVLLHWTHE